MPTVLFLPTRRARPRWRFLLAVLTLAALLAGSGSAGARSLAGDGQGVERANPQARDTTPPTVPTRLRATPSVTSVTLTWVASRDNVGVSAYVVTVGPKTLTVTTPKATVTGLKPVTSYAVTVRAKDRAGNLSAPTRTTIKTLPDTKAPSAPVAPVVTPATFGARLAWTASSDDVAVHHYHVSVGTFVKDVTNTQVWMGPFTPGTSYTGTLAAVDAAGNISAAVSFAFTTLTPPDTTEPTPPSDLSVSATPTAAEVRWTASTDAVGVSGYTVTLSAGEATVSTTSVAGTSVTLSGLTPATAYTVSVTASDAAGNVSAAASATFTTADPPDTTAPTPPTALSVSPAGTTATANWTASTDAVGVSGYTVTLSAGEAAVSTTSVAGTSVTLSGLSPATAYTVSVTASDAAGNVSDPARALFTTLSAPGEAVYYVSPDGSDTNPGSQDAPLQSVQAAVDAARPGTTIRLMAGIYTGSTITVRTSGTADAPIVIQPAGDGPVILRHPVTEAACTTTSAAQDRAIKFTDGVDHWTIEGLRIENGIWINGKRGADAYTWLTSYVNAGQWEPRRAAPGRGTAEPEVSRTDLVPYLRTVTNSPTMDRAEGIRIRGNDITGRGIHATFAAYGEISGNRIHDIDCGTGPGIWLITYSDGWSLTGNEIWDIAESAVHFMQEGIRMGSASNYNEVSGNQVHDLPGDGRGINTDVDSSFNRIHDNEVRGVAIGYNDQMSGWGNRWERNLVADYRQYGYSIRMKDSALTAPDLSLSTKDVLLRCNAAQNAVGTAKAFGAGTSTGGTFNGNDFPLVFLSPNLRTYWSSAGNTWDGSGDVPPAAPPYDPSGC